MEPGGQIIGHRRLHPDEYFLIYSTLKKTASLLDKLISCLLSEMSATSRWATMFLAALRTPLQILLVFVTACAPGFAQNNNPTIEEQFLGAIGNGDSQKVAELLRAGVDPNLAVGYYEKLPLLYQAITAHQPNLRLIETLIDAGADVNGYYSQAPVQPPDRSSSGKLLTTIANAVRIEGQTPLHYAARHSNPEVVALLVRRGAAITAKNARGESPIFSVLFTKQANAEVLLKLGSDINARDNSGFTVLKLRKQWLAMEKSRSAKQEAYIQWLISAGATE